MKSVWKKRVVSILLAVFMIVGLLPMVTAREVKADTDLGQARVIVENTTLAKKDGAPWEGTLIDKWVDLEDTSTAMSCIVAACGDNIDVEDSSFGRYINGIGGLEAYDGGSASGWMGTLNDWFTSSGFDAYTVADQTLVAGDVIKVMYSLNYGEDIGQGAYGTTDSSLADLGFSVGTLSPAFSKDTKEYTLTVSANTAKVSVDALATYKQFRVYVNGVANRPATKVEVSDGAEIVIRCGEEDGGTTYTVKVKKVDWPSFRGNEYNNGITSAKTPRSAEDVEVLWTKKYSTGWNDAPSPMIIVDDAVYSMYGNTLKKLSAKDGEVIASAEMVAATSWGTVPPTYADGMIFCPLSEGKIQAFDAESMTSLWTYTDENGGQAQSPITYADGKVYVGFGYGTTSGFVCLDAKQGDLKWRREDSQGFYWAGAVVAGDYVVYGNDAGHLFSYNKETGELVTDLTVDDNSKIRSTVCYDNGKVYFTTNNAKICVADLDSSTGKLSNLKMEECSSYGTTSTSTPVVYQGMIYIGVGAFSGNKNILGIDAETLKVKWNVEQPADPKGSILLSDAKKETGYVYLYVTYNNNPGGINVIKAKIDGSEATGSVLYDASGYEQFCTCSVIADQDGNLYYKNDSGYIFALRSNVETNDVQKLISNIGKVNLSSETDIVKARDAYNSLNDEQKTRVANYTDLVVAESILATKKEAAQEKAEAEAKAEAEKAEAAKKAAAEAKAEAERLAAIEKVQKEQEIAGLKAAAQAQDQNAKNVLDLIQKSPSKVTVKVSDTTLKTTWDAVEGTTSYKVSIYRNGKLYKTENVEGTVYDAKVSAACYYTVKVAPLAAYGDVTYTGVEKASAKVVVKPAKPSVTTKKNGTKVTVKTKKQTATGYQIKISTSKKFANSKTKTYTVKVKSNKALSKKYTLKKGTNYIKVRAYKTISGKKYYSAWSTVKTVKR